MCTIIGYHKLNKDAIPSDNFISQGFTLMKHRGPDAENYKLFNNTVCIGHQRLSIIDTSDRGNQPMETERSAIVFNGEVYNYIELKKELNKKNYYSNSDTEVLLTGFEEAGVNFLNKCNGMFAFAFLNKFSSELFLVRDRFGVKPLHYLVQNGVLYFSSEIKPLISIKKDLQKNKNIYSSFLLNTATDYNEETFIKDIWQLPKGHYLICKDGKIEIKQWYFGKDYDFDEKIFKNHRATIDFTENLLTDAISKRLRSDVPMAITLSGGLDSSTIYTLIKERLNANISPFTFIHPGSPTDELHIVEQLIKDYDDKLTTVTTDHESGIKDFEESLKYLEFPIWNLSAIAYLEMYKQIHSRDIKVILEGHGSDEQLGGYSFMIYPAAIEMYKRKKYLLALQLINVIHRTDNPALGQTQQIQKIALNILKMILSTKPQKDFNQCVEDTWNYNILPMVLRTFDRLPMRSSIESRSPFLDYRIVEFFKKMPTEYKVSSIGSKAILREILKKYNKECVYKNRAKMGFALDVNSFIKVKSNQDYLRNLIKNFQTNNFDGLKIKALDNIENSDWSDVGLVWKLASISYINKIYKI